jgi:cell wall-associated NlpC family hydrolase
MKIKSFYLVLLILAVGCTPNPRYRNGGGEMPAESKSTVSHRSTNSAIRFGRILQGYLGKPYAGSSRFDPGMDCSLFSGEVFNKYAKIKLPRTAEDQFGAGKPVDRGHLQFGDLVFFDTNGKKISHVGIYVGNNEFIHASTSNGVIISNLNEKYWSKRYLGARSVLD